MKNVVSAFLFAALVVCFSYSTASAQIVDAVKDAASKTKEVTKDVAGKTKDAAGKTKDVTVDASKKTVVVVTDGLDTAGDKTGKAVKVGASKTQKFGNTAVNVTENVAGDVYEGGKYYTVKTWDGTKWVSKRVWYATKKSAGATKDLVVGDDPQKP